MRANFLLKAGVLAVVLWAASGCGRREPAHQAADENGGAHAPRSAVVVNLPVIAASPSWTLKDVNGREVKSTDFAGKVVLVDFWATWCAPCRVEIPEYIAWQKKYAERGLVILGLSLDQAEPAEVREFAERQKMNYPVIMASGEVAETFPDFKGYLPTAYLIDRGGNVRHIKTGLADMKAFEAMVNSLL